MKSLTTTIVLLLSSTTAFHLLPTTDRTNIHPWSPLCMGGTSPQSESSVQRPRNEFSRAVSPDQVLKLHGKHSSLRQYEVDIDASAEECQALAQRFQLPEIASLNANLFLSPEARNTALDNYARGILVQGTAHATVTQTCVRTNEKFTQEVEFPIYTIVRPVEGQGPMVMPENDVPLSRSSSKTANEKRKNKKSNGEYDNEEMTMDPDELLKLQTMLGDMEELEQEDAFDNVFEDAAIFAKNQVLDVGELVSQLFWLQLDPYPRKPGGPETVRFSISG